MLSFFYQFHLKRDLIFLPQIKSNTVHLSDPIFRQKIRIRNQTDEFIENKYFLENGFNLRKLVKICIKQFFPNKGWRWVAIKHFAHEITIKILLHGFEYGLWKPKDLDWILVRLYSISEIMLNLENFIFQDSKRAWSSNYEPAFQRWAQQCATIRESIAKCFLHLIIYHLDLDVYENFFHFPVEVDTKLFDPFDFS